MIGFGRSDNLVETGKFLECCSVEFAKHFVIVETGIVAAVLGHAGDIGSFELLQHILHVVGGHLGAVVTDDRTEVQEFSKFDSVILTSSGFGADFCCVGKDFQCTVWSEIEDITVLLASAITGSVWALNTEYGLHISLRIRVVRTGEHHYC